MRIALVSPPQRHEGGNTTTVRRWERILRELGHEPAAERVDLLIALHAARSASAITAFRGPVVVAATGTDLYPGSPEATASFRRAWRVVVLNPLAVDALPEDVRPRARVIRQSVIPLDLTPSQDPPYTVAVVGHLRAVKDPLLVARAAAGLPSDSRIRVVQVGAALDAELEQAARAEEVRNPRYRWLGGLPRDRALAVLAAAHLLAVPSVLEGGANVLGEAIAHRVPPIGTRIDGNVGLLGADWPGLFEVGDREGLAALLTRWEHDARLRSALMEGTERLRADFAPEREREAWAALLAELPS